MRRFFALIVTVVALAAAGCASFGIKPAGPADAREGRDYTILIRAWDKDADEISVTIRYRANGGPWVERQGIFNGSLYECRVPGSELTAGYLEYVAHMRNGKGKLVSTAPVSVKVMSFAEARDKAMNEYRSLLSDGGTANEFVFDEPVVVALTARGAAASGKATCTFTTARGNVQASVSSTGGGRFEATVAPPHAVSVYNYQWTVTVNHPEFGDITVQYPTSPRVVSILDLASFRARVEKEFRGALQHQGPLKGDYFSPPEVEARLSYGDLVSRYSTGPRRMALVLRRGTYEREIPMAEVSAGRFRATAPAQDLEEGALSYSFRYADTFRSIGTLVWNYPAEGSPLRIQYSSLADMRRSAGEKLASSFTHQTPTNAVEGRAIDFTVSARDAKLRVLAVILVPDSGFAGGKEIPFILRDGAWYASVPGALSRPGTFSYRIRATVQDAKLGEVQVLIPRGGSYALTIASLAAFRADAEARLARSLAHLPPQATRGQAVSLTVTQRPVAPGSTASLFLRTAERAQYREIAGTLTGEFWTFTISPADANSRLLQYYFVVSADDPVAGRVTATFRDQSGGALNDFVVAPTEPGAATPPAQPAPTQPTAQADEPFAHESLYAGTKADRHGIKFFVTMKNELGLYDVSVMVRVQNRDRDYREFRMERKGKTFSYDFSTSDIPIGGRVDFYYVVYRKGARERSLSDANGVPFYAVIQEALTQ
jgi:hypothetical protein